MEKEQLEKLVDKMRMETILKQKTEKLYNQGETFTIAKKDQKNFMSAHTFSNPIESGYRMMIEGLEIYCRGIKKDSDSTIGNDYYLAPYVEDIAKALIGLASGTGKFDGGTIDETIRQIAKENNFYWEE